MQNSDDLKDGEMLSIGLKFDGITAKEIASRIGYSTKVIYRLKNRDKILDFQKDKIVKASGDDRLFDQDTAKERKKLDEIGHNVYSWDYFLKNIVDDVDQLERDVGLKPGRLRNASERYFNFTGKDIARIMLALDLTVNDMQNFLIDLPKRKERENLKASLKSKYGEPKEKREYWHFRKIGGRWHFGN